MHIVASFEYSTDLELALTAIEQEGISPEHIFVVPLERKVGGKNMVDTINRSDGVGTFDGAAALGTVFMLLGTIYGFSLTWGPIIWGGIGLLLGLVVGYLLDYLLVEHTSKHRYRKKLGGKHTEVFVVVECPEKKGETVENILWRYFALGVAKVS